MGYRQFLKRNDDIHTAHRFIKEARGMLN